MLANLTVDAELLQTAIDLDTENTKETIVEAALREYIYHRQQLKDAVMVGAAAADRGDVIDGETAIAALQEKLNRDHPRIELRAMDGKSLQDCDYGGSRFFYRVRAATGHES
jgi:predicted transcriptional regulator